MDVTDVKILELLQENSRVSISEISKKVNMSLSAVSERLKKLESTDIIEKYTVILNPQYLGKELSVLMNRPFPEDRNEKYPHPGSTDEPDQSLSGHHEDLHQYHSFQSEEQLLRCSSCRLIRTNCILWPGTRLSVSGFFLLTQTLF